MPATLLRGIAHLAGVRFPGPARGWNWEEATRRVLALAHLDRGRDAIVRKMIHLLAERGAHVARSGQLRRIFIDQGVLVGIQVGDHSRMISTRAGLNGADSYVLGTLMSETTGAAPAPTGWVFDMKFECEVPAIPAGVTTRMIHVEDEAPVLEVIREAPGAFLLRTALPMEDRSLDRGFQRRLCERMMKVAGRLIPDLEYSVRRMVPDLRDVERTESLELPSIFPYRTLDQIPPGRRLFTGNGAPASGFRISNLHALNDEVSPEQGAIGPYRSAIALFEMASRKRDPGMVLAPMPPIDLLS
ncbi:hypothetical protein EB061_12105 [bacterium]|nr:hypothetical protein [bacterium]